ncbi:MAG: TonB-dependent receptor [Bacteroidota bacterium]|nr:TonB-dependent receptor [Bacteroidota bacterium]MDP4247064.1 TonB-dependent receptor [Bacteroidota bacterium]MDP4257362.1 TonB-dependent receptor [Bacteroidota bacterium]
MRVFVLLLAILSFSAFTRSSAQEKTTRLITGDFQGWDFDAFVRMAEASTPYRFYYNSAQLDSVCIYLHVGEQPLEKVLDQIFAGTAFHYAIVDQRDVFVSKGLTIRTELPPGFFGNQEPQMAAEGTAPVKDLTSDKPLKQVTSENKLYEIGRKTNHILPGEGVISGTIRNARTGEPVAGAAVYSDKSGAGGATDQYGYYSIRLPRGPHIINVQGLGMRDGRYQVVLYSDGKLDIDLREQVTTLREVVVSAEKTVNLRRVQLGVEHLDIKTIKQVPTVMGEADVLRVVLTLPGVKTAGEASTGLNVRGGAADENLILFNDATIYNPSHFFGMFSAFNPDVVKDIELYKSSIPAKYGGRSSSVLDITSREGNKKNFSGSAGIGLLTSRIMLEGPIVKDKTSFILGGRTTYANWLLGALPKQYDHSRGNFNDLDLSISHQMNAKNTFYFTGYTSNDRFNLNNDTVYSYGNRNLSAKWKHVFSDRLNGTLTAGYDRYQYKVTGSNVPTSAFTLGFDINQFNLKTDFTWYLSAKHTITFGAGSIRYLLHPGSYLPTGKASLVVPDIVASEQALESAAYISDRYNITPALSLDAGLRYSLYDYLGPQTINLYAPGLPVLTVNQTGTKEYGKNKVVNTYQGPEYRFSVRYAITNSFSVKAGYNSLRQYIHMLSNTTSMAPTDIWKLSDPHIRPELGDQVSFGVYKNLHANTIETSVEVYYKRLHDYLDYRSGATLIMNHHIETDVLNTKGKAYGVEVMIKRLTGKLNGWVSYTWSRTLLRTDDPTAGETVNNGNYYPSDFDQPHNVNLVGNFRVNHRFSVSLNAVYSTGRPITLPIGRYYYGGSVRVIYADRNSYRIPDYFRTDFSMNIDGNHKVHQWTHNSWTIGVYNLTGRHNPYSVYFISENGAVNGYKLSIFGSAIPFVNFNIRF